MAADVPPPIATGDADAPVPGSGSGRRGRLVLVALLVLGLVAAGVVWSLERDSGPAGPVAEPWTLEPHQGLAAWVDAFDWSHALGRRDAGGG